MVEAGRQRDFGTEIRGLDLKTGELVMLGASLVHMIGVDDVRLALLHTGRQDTDPELARRDAADDRHVLGRAQPPFRVLLDGAHEVIGDQHTVMQVQRLAVRIATRWATHFNEFLDLGVPDRQIDRRRAATQRSLGNSQRQAVHHTNEGDNARGLAVLADILTDRTQIAPVGTNTAALGGQPDILVPQIDDTAQAVIGLIQEAGDRKAARGATIREHRGSGHEPMLRDVVVKTLRMGGIGAVIGSNATEEILIVFAGQQIAVIQRRTTEIGQQRIPRAVDAHRVMAFKLHHIIKHIGFGLDLLRRAVARLGQDVSRCRNSLTGRVF